MNNILNLAIEAGTVPIPLEVSNKIVDLLRYIWIIPIIVGFATSILTIWFNRKKDVKDYRLEHRAFIKWHFRIKKNPFELNDADLKNILLIENGNTKKMSELKGAHIQYIRYENITQNDIAFIQIKVDVNGRINKYFLHSWEHDSVLFIPLYSNEIIDKKIIKMTYTTLADEKFILLHKEVYFRDGDIIHDSYVERTVHLVKFKIFKFKLFSHKEKHNTSTNTTTRMFLALNKDDKKDSKDLNKQKG